VDNHHKRKGVKKRQIGPNITENKRDRRGEKQEVQKEDDCWVCAEGATGTKILEERREFRKCEGKISRW